MPVFNVNYIKTTYGHVLIEADTQSEAEDRFHQVDYMNCREEVAGNIQVTSVEKTPLRRGVAGSVTNS